MNNPAWYEVYSAFWRPLNESQRMTWEYELLQGPQKIRQCTGEMISTALRRLSRKTDKDGRAITPGLQQVRDELFAMMREKRAEMVNSLPKERCDICNNTTMICGVRAIHDAEINKIIIGICASNDCKECDKPENTVCYDIGIPCVCRQGEQKLTMGGYKDQNAVRKLQEMALGAIRSRRNKESIPREGSRSFNDLSGILAASKKA